MGKEHGKDSGVTSTDLVKSGDISKLPGKSTNVPDNGLGGNQYNDHGGLCEGEGPDMQGCFMSSDQRERYITDFKLRVTAAAARFNMAIESLKLEELMKKEDDMHWVLGLALDLASNFVIGSAVKALTKAKAGKIADLATAAHDATMGGRYEAADKSDRMKQLLHSISDDSIKTRVTAVGGLVKTKAKGIVQAATADVDVPKSAAVGYLTRLQSSCDIAFAEFADNAAGNATDAEILVLWDGMHISNHTVELYKAALGEKLNRFKKSGLPSVGRAGDKFTGDITDKKVIWVQHPDGTKTLRFQSHTSKDSPSSMRAGEPGTRDMFPNHKDKFGELGSGELKLGSEVPREFWEEAVSISESKWGEPVKTVNGPKTARLDGLKPRTPAVDNTVAATVIRTDVPNNDYSSSDMMKDMGAK